MVTQIISLKAILNQEYRTNSLGTVLFGNDIKMVSVLKYKQL